MNHADDGADHDADHDVDDDADDADQQYTSNLWLGCRPSRKKSATRKLANAMHYLFKGRGRPRSRAGPSHRLGLVAVEQQSLVARSPVDQGREGGTKETKMDPRGSP